MCVRIIAILFSYCIVSPVKVTKGTSVHSAADVADESLRFYFLEREERRRATEKWKIGTNMEI